MNNKLINIIKKMEPNNCLESLIFDNIIELCQTDEDFINLYDDMKSVLTAALCFNKDMLKREVDNILYYTSNIFMLENLTNVKNYFEFELGMLGYNQNKENSNIDNIHALYNLAFAHIVERLYNKFYKIRDCSQHINKLQTAVTELSLLTYNRFEELFNKKIIVDINNINNYIEKIDKILKNINDDILKNYDSSLKL